MKLIWTKKALEAWVSGKSDPMHTISAPNIGDVYDGFVRQFKTGTPWALIADDGLTVVATGTAGLSVVA